MLQRANEKRNVIFGNVEFHKEGCTASVAAWCIGEPAGGKNQPPA